ncbi:MAG: DUF1002 domain-containing protein [Lachnospiraceae bacterium]|nr:DUF1002 domain-containing protein [Lachnospiraceae bacterium]
MVKNRIKILSLILAGTFFTGNVFSGAAFENVTKVATAVETDDEDLNSDSSEIVDPDLNSNNSSNATYTDDTTDSTAATEAPTPTPTDTFVNNSNGVSIDDEEENSTIVTPGDADTTTTEEPVVDTSFTPYISFGDSLNASEKATVMKLLGVTDADLSSYKVIYVSNKEEYEYLGNYISKAQIGSRALSSVKVVKTEDGEGIKVTTYNINYCSAAMYQNALITAGIEDASVTVAGPFSLSGTAALVGAMKSYSAMTGEDISKTTMNTATEELITTAEIAESIGDTAKATELIAATKQKLFEDQLSSETDIRDALAVCSDALKVNLTEEDQKKIVDLMMKIKDENVDVNAIKEQAKNIYDKLKDSGIDFKNIDTTELKEKTGGFFANIFNAIKDFFTGLFG